METIKTIDLNRLKDEAYNNAVEHGWHDEDLSDEISFAWSLAS